MKYKRCSEVDRTLIYKSFSSGYSDYAIPMQISPDLFFERFFGPEGNNLEDSFIAFSNDEPVGLILGGIRTFDGYKNLRCGTLCVTPEYRGEGISQELFRLFEENGTNQHCERLSLEVLSDNERAIRFYEKQGFKKSNKLIYFSHLLDVHPIEQNRIDNLITIKEVNLSAAANARNSILFTHINWQNEVDYFMRDCTAHCLTAFRDEQQVGTLVITDAGKIYFLYVNEGERQKGMASNLLLHAINHLKLQQLKISMPETIDLTEFLRKVGFKKDTIEQFEMHKLT